MQKKKKEFYLILKSISNFFDKNKIIIHIWIRLVFTKWLLKRSIFSFWIYFKTFNSFTNYCAKIKKNLHKFKLVKNKWFRLITRIFSRSREPKQSGCKECGGSKEQQNWKRLFSLDKRFPRRFETVIKYGLCFNNISSPWNKILIKLYFDIKINYIK